MASRTVERNAAERIEQVCRSTTDAMQLRIQALAEIGKVIDCDAHVWLLTDPITTVGGAAGRRAVPELPEAIRLKYLTGVNRWTHLHADGSGVGLLLQAT